MTADETEGGWDDQFINDLRTEQMLDHHDRRIARLKRFMPGYDSSARPDHTDDDREQS
jgi:hypothetical protein